jgi:hypothetical protein
MPCKRPVIWLRRMSMVMEADETALLDEEDRAIQMRSFMALAWVAIFVAGFTWCVMEYMKEARTVDCITFVSAPNYAPPPGTCKREKKAFR